MLQPIGLFMNRILFVQKDSGYFSKAYEVFIAYAKRMSNRYQNYDY